MIYLKKFTAICMVLLITSLMLFGCASKTQEPAFSSVEVTDMKGNIVVIGHAPEKIISLSPTNTEILYALGLGDKVIGVTEYCDYPVDALSKEKVGDFIGPNIELIASLEPDIIFAQGYMHEDFAAQFEDLGILVVNTETGGYESAYDAIRLIGKATGTTLKAEEIVLGMTTKTDEIKQLVKNQPLARVFYVVEYAEDLWTASEGTFIHDIIVYGGGENIVKDTDSPWTMYSLERLLEDNPEVILTTDHSGTVDQIKGDPIFAQTDAVKNNKVYALKDQNAINRNGPRLSEALEEVAKLLHPELFQ